MASNCFTDVPHEALDFCPNNENAAGISTRLFYVPTEFVEKMELPAATGDYKARVTLQEADFALKADKNWKGIDVLVDENELKNSLVGNKGNMKAKSELEFYIPGIRSEVVGFIDTYKNVPMVLAVQDSNGVIWFVGSTVNPAYFESAEGSTGKKFEDNAGVAAKISANTRLLKFDGNIAEA